MLIFEDRDRSSIGFLIILKLTDACTLSRLIISLAFPGFIAFTLFKSSIETRLLSDWILIFASYLVKP